MKPQIRLQNLVATAATRKALTVAEKAAPEKGPRIVDAVQSPNGDFANKLMATIGLGVVSVCIAPMCWQTAELISVSWTIAVVCIFTHYRKWYRPL